MRSLTLLLLICLGVDLLVAQNQRRMANPGQLELNGDQLGESFASFSSRHTRVQCVDPSPKTRNCYQWEGISIFGMTAHPDPGCSVEKHSSTG